MRLKTLAASLAACLIATPAAAAITIGSVPGTNPYSGPTPTYDFSTPAPVTGGVITSGTVPFAHAQPYGSTGNYWSVGPADGTPGLMDLRSFDLIANISFIWGSIDGYNVLDVLDNNQNLLASFNGNSVFNPASGDQSSPQTNRLVTLLITGADQSAVGYLRLSASQNAFETDNFAINAVPEPGTWAMMLLGFGFIGVGMRRRRSAAFIQQAA